MLGENGPLLAQINWQIHKSERQKGGCGQSCDRFSLSPPVFSLLAGGEDEDAAGEAGSQLTDIQ